MKRIFLSMVAVIGVANINDSALGATPFDVFSERCLARGPDFDRTIAFAKNRNLLGLAMDMSLGFVPVDNPLALEGWIVNEGGEPFQALVVSRASVGQKQVESCTMAFAGIDATGFEGALFDQTGATGSGEQNGQSRHRKFYTIEQNGRKEAVTLDLPLYPNGNDEVIASVVSEQQFEN
ncbi:hypothetical protein [Rhizobium ruizarguesonis]|uniref:hypothetical protein n=1 Tax=Rhizobium ruizarguesonis TaxID=2081791 RepID=UPI0016A9B6A0|nr:hypothetical protein [Rhizobium ruizarguesonis]NKQ87512.1 hypothetical protein [Rhizobium ruizarguesonis]